jgi:hypothetical protein
MGGIVESSPATFNYFGLVISDSLSVDQNITNEKKLVCRYFNFSCNKCGLCTEHPAGNYYREQRISAGDFRSPGYIQDKCTVC